MYSPVLTDYQLTSIIGQCSGGAAVVYSAVYKPNGANVAIKRFFVDRSQENTNFTQEILTTKELQHPNILPCLMSFVHGRDLYVISPLMELGSARDILTKHFQEGLPELTAAIILKGVLQALDYLHKQGYIHRGVRASHILLSAEGSVRLSGLGAAASLVGSGSRQPRLHELPPPNHQNTNLIWLSPELLEQTLKGYDERSDIYSVGVTACELGNGAVPFSQVPCTLMLTEKLRGARPTLLDASTLPARPPSHTLAENDKDECGVGDSMASSSALLHLRQVYASRHFSDHFHNFTELCLEREAEKRPSASQLLSHSFFRQIRKSDNLVTLLANVKPIQPMPDDIAALQLEERLSEMDIEKTTEWDF